MKKLFTFLCCALLAGCANYSKVGSPRYFNTDVEILEYTANPHSTEWILRAKPGETMRLIFDPEVINIDFTPDPKQPDEYIFTVKKNN